MIGTYPANEADAFRKVHTRLDLRARSRDWRDTLEACLSKPDSRQR